MGSLERTLLEMPPKTPWQMLGTPVPQEASDLDKNEGEGTIPELMWPSLFPELWLEATVTGSICCTLGGRDAAGAGPSGNPYKQHPMLEASLPHGLPYTTSYSSGGHGPLNHLLLPSSQAVPATLT